MPFASPAWALCLSAAAADSLEAARPRGIRPRVKHPPSGVATKEAHTGTKLRAQDEAGRGPPRGASAGRVCWGTPSSSTQGCEEGRDLTWERRHADPSGGCQCQKPVAISPGSCQLVTQLPGFRLVPPQPQPPRQRGQEPRVWAGEAHSPPRTPPSRGAPLPGGGRPERRRHGGFAAPQHPFTRQNLNRPVGRVAVAGDHK